MAEPVVNIRARGRNYAPPVTDVEWVDATSGCATASLTVHDPATVNALVDAESISEDSAVVISDPRSAHVLWTGTVGRSGLQRSPLGDSATIRCVGNTSAFFASFWRLPYVVRDSYGDWEREVIRYASTKYFETSTGARPSEPPKDSLIFSIRSDQEVVPQIQARQQYMGHMGTDMWIGGMSAWLDASHSPTGWRSTLWVGDQFWGHDPIRVSWSSTEELYQPIAGGPDWPMPPKPSESDPATSVENYLVAQSSWEPVAGVPGFKTNADYWSSWHSVHVVGQRVNRHGNNLTTPRIGHVYGHEIVEDIIGRCMTGVVDVTLTAIADTTFPITHADYRDPTSPGELLDDMVTLHPDHYWRVGPTTSQGLCGFVWQPWESGARYVIDDGAQVDLDGAPDDLYNRVTVLWTDWRGRRRSKTFKANPAVYPDVAGIKGVHEPPPLDLDASLGQSENVERIGTMWLDQVARRVPSGTLTVGSVLDVKTQQRIPAAHIEAATTATLASDPDGFVHRVVEVAHPDLDTAVLSVGRPRLSLDQIVALRGRRRR